MIFTLRRPDILPLGDLGIRRGMSLHFNIPAPANVKKNPKTFSNGVYLPTPDELMERAEIWRPYRSIGSWWMWQVGGGAM